MHVRRLLPAALLAAVGCRSAPANAPPPAAPSRATPAGALPLAAHDSLPPGILRGRVRAELPSYPTRGVEVEAVGVGRTRVDSLGAFELHGLAPGLHHLRVRAVGFRPLDAAIRMPAAGSVVSITLALPRHCLDACPGPTQQPESRIAAMP